MCRQISYFDTFDNVAMDASKDDLEKQRNMLEEKEKSNKIEKKQKVNEELHEIAVKLTHLSTEYYYLMPKSGFDFTRLKILDSDYNIKNEENRVNHLLEFEVAERLLLGAMYRKNEVHPCKCLNLPSN